MPSLCFITPAHERFEMTSICLEQRRRVCDELALSGIDATCVVLADDDNLTTARDLGFETLQTPNFTLGRRWNDGIEHACRELGADFVAPLGTDDWVQADYVRRLPEPGTVRTSHSLALVDPRGEALSCLGPQTELNVRGFIPWIIPRQLLAASNFRPNRDSRPTGCESHLANSIESRNRTAVFEMADHDFLQVVDFKSPSTQLTTYDRTVRYNDVAWKSARPFERLATRYPADLCERMERLYRGGHRA